MPYPWGREDEHLLEHYRTLGRIRNSNSVYKKGAFRLIQLDERLLVFSRGDGAYKLVTVVNNSDDEISICFDRKTRELVLGANAELHHLGGNSAAIYKVKADTNMEVG